MGKMGFLKSKGQKKTPKIDFFEIFPEVSVKTLLRAGKDLNYGSFSFLTLGVKLGRIEKNSILCDFFGLLTPYYSKTPFPTFLCRIFDGLQNIPGTQKNVPKISTLTFLKPF